MPHYGFNFLYWVRDFAYFHPDEGAFALIDRCLDTCLSRRLHLSLNLHRGPGYCNDLARYNLWVNQEAQDALVLQGERFA